MDFKKSWGLCVALTLIAAGMMGCEPDVNPNLCGEVTCGPNQTCINSECVDNQVETKCAASQTLCDDGCANLKNDELNCGACGNKCPGGQACVDGACSADCGTGKTVCDNKCFDLKKSRDNCGACGTACSGSEICNNGSCEVVCPSNMEKCDNACVDVKSDSHNCGSCGNECKDTEFCIDGKCGIQCTANQTLCGEICVNLKTDVENCGACGTKCDEGLVCSDGTCKFQCLSGQTACEGVGCIDTSSDVSNCGGCGNVCPGGTACKNGQCKVSCPTSQTQCGEECINVKNDNKNCGECGKECGEGLSCVDGECAQACPSGFGLNEFDVEIPHDICTGAEDETDCMPACSDEVKDGCCTVVEDGEGGEKCITKEHHSECVSLSSSENCGQIGNACESNERCVNGACSSESCQVGQAECAGGCIDASKDINFCGAKGSCSDRDPESANFLGVTCGDFQSCISGKCTCDDGLSFCKLDADMLSCVDAKNNADYCGCTEEDAGTNCALLDNVAESSCGDGVCKIAKCADGFADCDGDSSNGCEVEIANDIENCGACSNVCPNDNVVEDGLACTYGACTPTCKEGFGACDGKCIDFTNTNNCGACGNVCGESMICKQSGLTKTYGCQLPENICETIMNEDGEEFDYATYDVGGKKVKAYCIRTKAEFESVRTYLNNGEVYPKGNADNAFILVRDIKLGDLDGTTAAKTWSPIGTSGKPFTGIFIGNNHIISGDIACKAERCGVFGQTDGAVIYGADFDVKIHRYTATSGANTFYNYVGAIVGYALNTTIDNNNVKGMTDGNQYIGGIAGFAKNTVISNNSVEVDVSNRYQYIGGLVGRGEGVKISNCDYKGNIKGYHNYTSGQWVYAGGVAGYMTSATIKDENDKDVVVDSSVSDVTVNGTLDIHNHTYASNAFTENPTQYIKYGVGGIVGQVYNTSFSKVNANNQVVSPKGYHIGGFAGWTQNSKFENCVAVSDIDKGYRNVGGFAGHSEIDTQFDNCKATGNIRTEAAEAYVYTGGFVGELSYGMINNCVAEGKVEATTTYSSSSNYSYGYLGGLIGAASVISRFTNNVAKGDVIGDDKVTNVGGLAGYVSSSIMKNNSAFGKVQGRAYVGGLVGQLSSTNVENCSASGDVSKTYDQHYYGGLVGYSNGGNYRDSSAIGNVLGNYSVGAFVGRNQGNGSYERCAAFGNAKTENTGAGAAGFIGVIEGATAVTLDLCQAVGDATGAYAGGLIGYDKGGTNRIADSYATGKYEGSVASGAIIGRIIGGRVTMSDVYWWEGGSDSAYKLTGSTMTANSTYPTFGYSGTTPIVMQGERPKKLLNIMNANQDAWSSLSCNIVSGPANGKAGDYNLPVLRGMSIDICK